MSEQMNPYIKLNPEVFQMLKDSPLPIQSIEDIIDPNSTRQ